MQTRQVAQQGSGFVMDFSVIANVGSFYRGEKGFLVENTWCTPAFERFLVGIQ